MSESILTIPKDDCILKDDCASENRTDLPVNPDCNHNRSKRCCHMLTEEDVRNFQSRFYNNKDKIKQDIFILRHCAVSAPNKSISRGCIRKSVIFHYNIPTSRGNLLPVCRKAFTQLLGIKFGRVQGVLKRYLLSKKIPTENRGGDRLTPKFKEKRSAVVCYLDGFPRTLTHCPICGDPQKVITTENDMQYIWNNYNENTSQGLQVLKSFFKNVFVNSSYVLMNSKSNDRLKLRCHKCRKIKESQTKASLQDENEFIENDMELKILKMSFPPGEPFLLAPTPVNRKPIDSGNNSNDFTGIILTSDDSNLKKESKESYTILQNSEQSLYASLNQQMSECNDYYTSNQMYSQNSPNDLLTNCNNYILQLPSDNTSNFINDTLNKAWNISYDHQNLSLNIASAICKDYKLLHPETLDSPKINPPENDVEVNDKYYTTQQMSLKCEHCSKTFVRKDHYMKHVQIHSKDKPFRCDECGQLFSFEINLKLHQKRHTAISESEVKLYCQMCLKTFANQSELDRHSRVHRNSSKKT